MIGRGRAVSAPDVSSGSAGRLSTASATDPTVTMLGRRRHEALGQQRLTCSESGASDSRSAVRPKTSPGPGAALTGSAAAGRTERPRLHDGVISNRPIAGRETQQCKSRSWTRGLLISRPSPWRSAFFTTGPGGNIHRNPGGGRRPSLGDPGQL